MGFYDRDYYRGGHGYGPRSPFGAMRLWTVVTWLIVINVAVFLLDGFLRQYVRRPDGIVEIRPVFEMGYFSAATAIMGLQVWRFITFQFLHADLSHLFFNMLGMFFFGPMVESYLGKRRFLIFYLLCGIAGPLGYLLLWFPRSVGMPSVIEAAHIPLVGASAGLFGILVAAARVAPNTTVMLLFPPIPMRLKTLVWIYIAIAVFVVLTEGNNAGGQAAHLGGAGAGYLLMRYRGLLSWTRRFSGTKSQDWWRP